MIEQRAYQTLEVAEQEEYKSLFSSIVSNIETLTADVPSDDMQRRVFSLNIGPASSYIYFFDKPSDNVVGIYFSREHRESGQTYYLFHKENPPRADIQGYFIYGPGEYPDLWIAEPPLVTPTSPDSVAMEKMRGDPVEIDLPLLRDLNIFIENPVKNWHLTQKLQTFPGEEEYKQWAESLRNK